MEEYLHLLRNSWPHPDSPLCTRGLPPPSVCSLPPSSPSTSSQRAASLPRPALTSEPLGVVLGGAERGLRAKASVNYSVTGLEICSCG